MSNPEVSGEVAPGGKQTHVEGAMRAARAAIARSGLEGVPLVYSAETGETTVRQETAAQDVRPDETAPAYFEVKPGEEPLQTWPTRAEAGETAGRGLSMAVAKRAKRVAETAPIRRRRRVAA